jgi:hypothetical protein
VDLIPINLAVEDPLSEAVLRTILHQSNRRYIVGNCYSKNGFGYLKKNIMSLIRVDPREISVIFSSQKHLSYHDLSVFWHTVLMFENFDRI